MLPVRPVRFAAELSPVVDVSGKELAKACASFYDAVLEGRASISRHESLDSAIAGARRRDVGNVWAWARRDTRTDVSPLVAATIARWAAMHVEGGVPVFAY